MHVIQYSNRIYFLILFCLCAAFFLAPSLANAADGYWSTQERRFVSQAEVNRNVQRILDTAVKKPSGSTLGASPTTSSAPTVTKNAAGGLSASTNQILKTMGQPSPFQSTLNNSLGDAKNALKSCVRSPACAVRGLGAGAIIYEGIHAWKEVYDLTLGDNGNVSMPNNNPTPEDFPYMQPSQASGLIETQGKPINVGLSVGCGSSSATVTLVDCKETDWYIYRMNCNANYGNSSGAPLVGYIPAPTITGNYICQYDPSLPASESKEGYAPYKELTPTALDSLIDESYEPDVSDAPIVLLSGEPDTITLSTPAPAELPSTTTTDTSSGGQTTTSVTNKTINYNVTNNNTKSPSINSSLVETTTTYDDVGNVTDISTSTTTASGVQSESPPSTDIELPAFCTWASIVCDWIGWTKEGIEGEEPDLINLISEFEPDEDGYVSSIGSGSCPAPMSVYLSIVKQTVEVSYQPFCDFLEMIRPLVIAGAWLLSAFMYVGVLRRG